MQANLSHCVAKRAFRLSRSTENCGFRVASPHRLREGSQPLRQYCCICESFAILAPDPNRPDTHAPAPTHPAQSTQETPSLLADTIATVALELGRASSRESM